MMRAHPTHVMLETMTFPKRSWSHPVTSKPVFTFSYIKATRSDGSVYVLNASRVVTWKGVTV